MGCTSENLKMIGRQFMEIAALSGVVQGIHARKKPPRESANMGA